jgi:hypothetical protein
MIPSATADFSLYQSSRQYRTTTAGVGVVGGVRLAGYWDGWCNYKKCTECRATCDPAWPEECRFVCRRACKGCRT